MYLNTYIKTLKLHDKNKTLNRKDSLFRIKRKGEGNNTGTVPIQL